MNEAELDKLVHDIKNPLTAIRGYASMLMEGAYGELNEGAKQAVEKINKANDKLIDLIEINFKKD